MVCGFLGCDSGLTEPIVSTLPPSMILKVDEHAGGRLDPLDLPVRCRRSRGRTDRFDGGPVQALGVAVRRGRAAVRAEHPRRANRLAGRIARSRRFPRAGAHARRHRPRLERRGARTRSRLIALGPRRKVHPRDRRGADALPRRLAPAGRRAKAAGLWRSAGSDRRTGRIRIGGGVLPRVQEEVRSAAPATWRRGEGGG